MMRQAWARAGGRLGRLLGVVAAVLLAGAAQAQDIAVSAKADRESVRPGGVVVIAVVMDHPDGFHTWPGANVELPKSVDETAERTRIGLGKGGPRFIREAGLQWPETYPGEVPDLATGGRVTVPLYSGRAVAFVTVGVAEDAPVGPVSIPVALSYQACDDQVCYPGESPVLKVNVTVTADAPLEGSRAGDFAAYRPVEVQGWRMPDAGSAGGGDDAPAAESPSLFGVGFGGGLIVLFLVAALGGAVLNLTPCVLPVIPIKVMTLVEHAKSPGRRLMLGFWMAVGVVAFWTAVGLPMAILNTAYDPSRVLFGTWWVTLGLGLVIAAMGLGIMGLFNFSLPQFAYGVNVRADSVTGSLLFGVMTGVLGLPCFGFVAGGLLAGAATLPPLTIMVVFVGLGVGMAAPYLVLSARPGLVERIPRTGPASDLVKQVMGLLLLAAAAYFVAAGIRVLLTDYPYMSASLVWWVVAFFVAITGAWTAARTLRIARSAAWSSLVTLASAGVVFAAVAFAWVSTRTDRLDWERTRGEARADDSIVPGAWLPYNPRRLEKALASGRVVVVDFTADWCINCKFLKRTVLDSDSVRGRFERDGAILIEVDNTSRASPGWDYLRSLGRTAVPTLAVYGPGVESPLIYNAYRAETVLDAMDRAGRAPVAEGPRGPD